MLRQVRTYCWMAAAVLLGSTLLWAAKDFVMPKASPAASYASKDAHPMEKVAAAVDVYNTAPKDNIFVSHFVEEGILPVFLVITNDRDQPISVNNMRTQLVTAHNAKLDALETDDIFRRVAHIQGHSSPRNVGPITLPGGNKNKKAQQQYSEIVSARFLAEAVEPHTTRAGFVFFDVQDVKQPVDGAHIYLTGLRDAGGNELMFFDIPIAPQVGN